MYDKSDMTAEWVSKLDLSTYITRGYDISGVSRSTNYGHELQLSFRACISDGVYVGMDYVLYVDEGANIRLRLYQDDTEYILIFGSYFNFRERQSVLYIDNDTGGSVFTMTIGASETPSYSIVPLKDGVYVMVNGEFVHKLSNINKSSGKPYNTGRKMREVLLS